MVEELRSRGYLEASGEPEEDAVPLSAFDDSSFRGCLGGADEVGSAGPLCKESSDIAGTVFPRSADIGGDHDQFRTGRSALVLLGIPLDEIDPSTQRRE